MRKMRERSYKGLKQSNKLMTIENMSNKFLAEVKEWGNRANVVMDRIEKRNEVALEEEPQEEEPQADEDTEDVGDGEKVDREELSKE